MPGARDGLTMRQPLDRKGVDTLGGRRRRLTHRSGPTTSPWESWVSRGGAGEPRRNDVRADGIAAPSPLHRPGGQALDEVFLEEGKEDGHRDGADHHTGGKLAPLDLVLAGHVHVRNDATSASCLISRGYAISRATERRRMLRRQRVRPQAEPNRASRRSRRPSPSSNIRHGRPTATARRRRATTHPKRNRRDKGLEIQARNLEDWRQLRTEGTPSPHPAWSARVVRCALTSYQTPLEAALDTLGRFRFRATHPPRPGRLHGIPDQVSPPASVMPCRAAMR